MTILKVKHFLTRTYVSYSEQKILYILFFPFNSIVPTRTNAFVLWVIRGLIALKYQPHSNPPFEERRPLQKTPHQVLIIVIQHQQTRIYVSRFPIQSHKRAHAFSTLTYHQIVQQRKLFFQEIQQQLSDYVRLNILISI